MDKKITDLTLAQTVDGDDVSILARNGSDYQYSFSTFLQYLSKNLSVGASISFGKVLPQNPIGIDGDLFINIDDNSFAQRVNGTWVIKYTSAANDNDTVLYGTGLPSATLGNDGDTYVDTNIGIFYKKTSGTWAQVFSMQTGPAGPTGQKGDVGPPGANGSGIINGITNPSNLSLGNDGDFYINTDTQVWFGPKNNGDWGVGIPLMSQGWFEISDTDAGVSVDSFGRFSYQNDLLVGRENYLIEPKQLGQKLNTTNNIDVQFDAVAGRFTILVPGFVLDPASTIIVWVSMYVIPNSAGGNPPTGTGSSITLTSLPVITSSQTQFNISVFPTSECWLNINGLEYHQPEDFTISTINNNVTLTWLNSFPLDTSDSVKLFKD